MDIHTILRFLPILSSFFSIITLLITRGQCYIPFFFQGIIPTFSSGVWMRAVLPPRPLLFPIPRESSLLPFTDRTLCKNDNYSDTQVLFSQCVNERAYPLWPTRCWADCSHSVPHAPNADAEQQQYCTSNAPLNDPSMAHATSFVSRSWQEEELDEFKPCYGGGVASSPRIYDEADCGVVEAPIRECAGAIIKRVEESLEQSSRRSLEAEANMCRENTQELGRRLGKRRREEKEKQVRVNGEEGEEGANGAALEMRQERTRRQGPECIAIDESVIVVNGDCGSPVSPPSPPMCPSLPALGSHDVHSSSATALARAPSLWSPPEQAEAMKAPPSGPSAGTLCASLPTISTQRPEIASAVQSAGPLLSHPRTSSVAGPSFLYSLRQLDALHCGAPCNVPHSGTTRWVIPSLHRPISSPALPSHDQRAGGDSVLPHAPHFIYSSLSSSVTATALYPLPSSSATLPRGQPAPVLWQSPNLAHIDSFRRGRWIVPLENSEEGSTSLMLRVKSAAM